MTPISLNIAKTATGSTAARKRKLIRSYECFSKLYLIVNIPFSQLIIEATYQELMRMLSIENNLIQPATPRLLTQDC